MTRESRLEMVQVAAEKSLNQSMDKALKHYASLFFLPSFKRAVGLTVALCLGAVALPMFAIFPSVEGLAYSLNLGISLFAVTLLSDYVLSRVVLRRDPIFVMRRATALSLYSWVFWLPFIVIGAVLGAGFGLSWWVNFVLLGFCAVLTLRATVFYGASTATTLKAVVASLLQPLGCMVPFLLFWVKFGVVDLAQAVLFLVASPWLCFAFAFAFISLIDRLGQREFGVPSMALFKAFMLNWVAGLNKPFEELLEKLGENADVEVSFLKFDASEPKAAIIVPTVHPGPFKNIGSSPLPALLKHKFEQAFGGNACVPLGILGHELDLASERQNQKVVDTVLASAKADAAFEKATPFVKVTDGSVTASCQIFGNTALLSFTLAPKTTEDLPQELSQVVRHEANRLGVEQAIVVNAHNSLTNINQIEEESMTPLQIAASECLKKAVSLTAKPFEVGAATVYPSEFSLKDGMGEGGITAVVVKVAEQKTAYIVIDGNNMVSGLREKILSSLSASGFDDGEVFTTDTHAVSAVVLGRRGYHPVGEAMDHPTLINRITEAASTASAKSERCRAGCLTLTVPEVRVIGEARLHTLTALIDRALHKAKQILIPLFAFEGLLLVLLLLTFL